MKVVIDSKIPYIRGEVETLGGHAVYLEGKEMTPEAVRDADALLIRTRTRVDRALLAGSEVRFVGTATIGFDHIDTAYCREAGIAWCNAPGCNAASVEQYVCSALLLLQRRRGLCLQGACLGVVGMGHVGSRVAQMAERLGMRVLRCDPPRAAAGEPGFLPLSALRQACDVLTFHTPLTRTGECPTWHLADEAFFADLPHPVYVINTSRGEVVDNVALLHALEAGCVKDAVVDVWEHEPEVDRRLLQRVLLGTPHIAGYSADGKANATRMTLDAFCRHFQLQGHYHIEPPAPALPVLEVDSWAEAQLRSYDPTVDSEALKAHPEQFEQLRGHYPLRRELSAYTVRIG